VTHDAAALRAQFPILAAGADGRRIHYLDNAASAQSPLAVLDAVRRYETTSRANVHRGVHRLAEAATAAYEAARATVARWLNVAGDEVVFTSGATAAINLVAHGFGNGLQPGDQVVISGIEHHANIVPWQMLRDRRQLRLDALPVTDDGRIDVSALQQVVTTRCRLIAVTHCSNVTGAETDVAAIVAAARAVGAAVLLDGAQRVPHGPLDLHALGVDFYAFAGHKAFGPNGVGVLWGRRERLAAMVPFMGGGEMIRRVTLETTTYADPPQRFEPGTPPIGPAIGLAAAIDWMAALDWPAATAHERALTERLLNGLGAIPGVRVVGPSGLQRRIGTVSFDVDGIHPHDVAQILDQYGVACRGGHHCAQPLMDRFDLAGTTRASLAPYNDAEDIDRLLEGIAAARRTFGLAR
jgi:cysteine desulfurase/selenocysteine lyase